MDDGISIPTLRCTRCDHEWVPRVSFVRACPNCKSPYWDIPRKELKEPEPEPEKKAVKKKVALNRKK